LDKQKEKKKGQYQKKDKKRTGKKAENTR